MFPIVVLIYSDSSLRRSPVPWEMEMCAYVITGLSRQSWMTQLCIRAAVSLSRGEWSCFAEIIRAVSGKGIERECCKDTLTQGPNVPRVHCWFTPDKSLHPYSETNVGVAVLRVSRNFP